MDDEQPILEVHGINSDTSTKSIRWHVQIREFVKLLFGAEFSIFLFTLASGIFQPAQQTFIYQQICLFKYNSEEICASLDKSPDLAVEESAVQNDFSLYSSYSNFCIAVPSLFVIVIMGSWCDRFSYLIPMALPHFGCAITTAFLLAYPYFPQLGLDPVYLSFASVASGITGGPSTITMVCAAYISRITTGKNRTIRLGAIEASLTLGGTLGNVVVAYVINGASPLVAFLIQICVNLYAIVFIFTVIPELHKYSDVKNKVQTESNGSWFRFIFAPRREILDGFFIFFGRSARYAPVRIYLQLMLAIFFVASSSLIGTSSITYEFLALNPISQSPFMYAIFQAVQAVTLSFGLLVGMRAFRYLFNLSDAAFIVIGLVSLMLSFLSLAFGDFYPAWPAWLNCALGMFSFYVFVPVRSGLSKLTEEAEHGRVFSLLSIAQTAGMLIFTVAFNSLYAALVTPSISSETLSYLIHGYSFIFATLLNIPPLIIAIWLGRQGIQNWSFHSSIGATQQHSLTFS